METALTADLWFAFFVTAIVGALLASRVLGPRLSLAVAVFKSGLAMAYFAVFYDATWNILDDITYWRVSMRLLEDGHTPISVLGNLSTLSSIAGGHHILYHWWNMVAMSVFGTHYYAPVFFNIALTFVAGLTLVGILAQLGYPRRYRRACFVFFLLHWDLLAWSTTLNVKDTLVLTLTAISLYGFSRMLSQPFSKREVALGVSYVSIAFFLLWWIRFYVPALVLFAVVGWSVLHLRPRLKYSLLTVSMLPLPILVRRGLWALDKLELSTLPYGVVRMMLTPRPWGINESYTFLVVPSFLHWVSLLFAAIGALYVNRTSRLGRVFLLYLLGTIVFYGAIPALQGPRHRYQLTFILAWLQFHFGWVVKEWVSFRYDGSLDSAI